MVDEVLGIITDILPVPLVIHHAAGAALVDEILEVLGSERGIAAKQGIGDDAKRPQVDGLAVALLEHHLGRRIAEGPSHGREHLILGPERLRNAKVCQDQFRIGCSGAIEKVLGFEIWASVRYSEESYPWILHTAMNDIVLVQVIDSAEHLLDSLRSILLGKLALLRNSIEQLSSSRKLRDDVVLVLNKGQVNFNRFRCVFRSPDTQRTLDSNQSTNLTMCGCLRR